MNSEFMLMQRIESLTTAVQLMATSLGQRLTREQLCERMGIHRNTLAKLVKDPRFPAPDRTGKFLLSDVIAYEQNR